MRYIQPRTEEQQAAVLNLMPSLRMREIPFSITLSEKSMTTEVTISTCELPYATDDVILQVIPLVGNKMQIIAQHLSYNWEDRTYKGIGGYFKHSKFPVNADASGVEVPLQEFHAVFWSAVNRSSNIRWHKENTNFGERIAVEII